MPPPAKLTDISSCDTFPYQKCDIAAKKKLIEQEYNIYCSVFNNFEGLFVG
ncbi:hypothetical protein BT96DRAFT_921804 [Gymnopus androsaceus JB14]|uniref:Uncharacterized protein n=1 Tax=Gymnopus androsaceus JB14 TaxID=1447944 RepID=A0A6A4HIE3_9AGAR|nr:hypothetical protein BT96DRAFT_921804 [Gymnopus androsaceus JB14]